MAAELEDLPSLLPAGFQHTRVGFGLVRFVRPDGPPFSGTGPFLRWARGTLERYFMAAELEDLPSLLLAGFQHTRVGFGLVRFVQKAPPNDRLYSGLRSIKP
jgi:hypothetical protein